MVLHADRDKLQIETGTTAHPAQDVASGFPARRGSSATDYAARARRAVKARMRTAQTRPALQGGGR
jgi:hypothetical protein